MTGRFLIETETYLPDGRSGNDIISQSSGCFSGDTPLEVEVAGHTTGMIGQGHGIAHGRYFSEKCNMWIYRKGLVD